jgi:Tol biopolymer transport system component
MNHSDGFDRTVSDWLHVDAEHRVPDHLDAVLRRTRTERQRPAWSSLERWLPVQTTLRFTPVPRIAWLLIITGLLVALGSAILFVAARPRVPPPFGIARNGPIVHDAPDGDIHVLDPVTGDTRTIVFGPERDVAPTISHDGSRIVFARETGPAGHAVFVVNADGTGVRGLTEPLLELAWYAFSPDDRRLAIVSEEGTTPTLRILSIDGSADLTLDLRTAAGLVVPKPSVGDAYVQWRPNGRELVFKGMSSGPGRTTYGLYLVGVDGTGLRPILAPSDKDQWQSPALSPDGTQLAWALWAEADGIGRIHIVDVDTGAVRVPFFDGLSTGDWAPAWSPDGERLVFNRLVGGGQEGLVVASASGGPVTEIGPRFPAFSGGAAAEFSPDGTSVIATYSQAGGEVYLLDPAGGPGRSLSIVADMGATMQRLAP